MVAVRKARFPTIKDRRKFLKYVVKTKSFDLFQNRVSSRAYFDRVQEGEAVPGIEVFERISLSVTKRGSK